MTALSILIWLPPAGCGGGAIASGAMRPSDSSRAIPGALALIGSIAALALSIGYIVEYTPGFQSAHLVTQTLQHVTNVTWIASLGIHYKLGIDGLNVLLVGL